MTVNSITLLAAAFVISGTSAIAQTPMSDQIMVRLTAAAEKVKAACSADISKFCGAVSPGEQRLLLCMMAHEDKLSTKCDYALYSASRNLEKALGFIEEASDTCWSDIEKNCSDMPDGGSVAQCLITKKATLTGECRATLDKFPVVK